MFKKNLSRCCLILFLLLVIISNNITYAEVVPVTHQNLKESLQKFVESETNDDGYTIRVEDNNINIGVEGQSYTMTYDISQKPTFLMEIPIQEGMSYEEFEQKSNSLILPMVGYVAVANVQGVEIKDASAYFLFSYMSNALSGGLSTENMYTIIDDLSMSEGVTIEKTDDPKTIYTSEFGSRVIEYVNNMYKEPQSISDSTGINSYVYSVEKAPVSDTACKLIAKLTVNTDADFSQIKGYASNINDAMLDSGITKENADFVVTLKEGQKCKIQSNESITGTEFYSNECVEFDMGNSQFTAKKVGTTNGYIYIGEEKKSIYITVEENEGNIYVQDLILNANGEEVNPPLNDNNEEEIDNSEESENNSTDKDLPKTGVDNLILIFLLLMFILVIVFKIKLNKFKDVK